MFRKEAKALMFHSAEKQSSAIQLQKIAGILISIASGELTLQKSLLIFQINKRIKSLQNKIKLLKLDAELIPNNVIGIHFLKNPTLYREKTLETIGILQSQLNRYETFLILIHTWNPKIHYFESVDTENGKINRFRFLEMLARFEDPKYIFIRLTHLLLASESGYILPQTLQTELNHSLEIDFLDIEILEVYFYATITNLRAKQAERK